MTRHKCTWKIEAKNYGSWIKPDWGARVICAHEGCAGWLTNEQAEEILTAHTQYQFIPIEKMKRYELARTLLMVRLNGSPEPQHDDGHTMFKNKDLREIIAILGGVESSELKVGG